MRKLVHQLGVDVQPAGRVENHYVGFEFLCPLDGRLAEGHRIGGIQVGVDGQAQLLAEHLQLLDGGGPLQVGGHEHRLSAALVDHPPQLAAGGRLARALQPAEHQHRNVGAEMERVVNGPHQVDQFLADDADQLLGGTERFRDRFAGCLFADAGHEVLDDRETDVGFEQSPLDQLQALAHVRLGEPAASPQRFDRRTEAFLKRLKHVARPRLPPKGQTATAAAF